MTPTPQVMTLLRSKVPLTLILDLVDAEHLPSRAILRREAGDASWLQREERQPH